MTFIVILVIVAAIVGGGLIYRNNKKSIDKAETKVKNVLDVLKK